MTRLEICVKTIACGTTLAVCAVAAWHNHRDAGALAAYFRGVELIGVSDYKDAAGMFTKAVDLAPDVALYHAALGLSFERGLSNSGDAISWSDRKVHARSEAAIHIRSQADHELTEAIAIDHFDPSSLNNLGWVRFDEGDMGGGLSLVSQARSVAPGDPEYIVSASLMMTKAGDAAGASRSASDALSLSPSLFYSSWFKSIEERCADCAKKIIQSALIATAMEREHGADPIVDARVGALYFISGQRDLGYGLIMQALERLPNLPEAWNFVGRYFESKGEMWSADQSFRKALFLDPPSANARVELCELQARRGTGVHGCEEALEWRFGGGLRSRSSIRTAHIYDLRTMNNVADDILPTGVLSFCCFVRPTEINQ
jgi:tetratricopeptide (TPR) repeat protein